MTFQRAKILGYAPHEVVLASELNTIDLNQSRAVDSNAGGPINPSADIVCTGVFNIRWDLTRWPKLTSRTMVRPHPVNALLGPNMSTFFLTPATDWNYAPITDANPLALRQAYVDVAGANIPLTHVDVTSMMPNLSVLTAVTCRMKAGQNVAHGALPSTKPVVDLWRLDLGGARQQVGTSTTHPSVTVGAYDSVNGVDVTVGGLSTNIDLDNGFRFLVRIRGEGSTNANGDLAIVSIVTSHTVTLIAP